MAKLAFILLACIAISAFVEYAEAQCCPNHFGKCNDGSSSGLCCGHRSCNFFCCSCGRCRARRSTRDVSGQEDKTGFELIDKDGSGHVDIDEAHAHLKTGKCGNYTELIVDFHKTFKVYDKDGDGKLSYAEINASG